MSKTQLWITEKQNKDTRFSIRISETLYHEISDFQEIMIGQSDWWGKVFFLDGMLMLTERDEFIYHEMLAHVPMASHDSPKRVLVIGGGDGGTVREVLKHNPEHVDLVEIDPRVVEISKKYLPFTASCLEDARVQVHCQDGAAWVREHPNSYDVILVDSTDPIGPGKVLVQEAFYKDSRAALKTGGVFSTQSQGPMLEGALVQEIYGELTKAFTHVAPYLAMTPSYPTGTWSMAYASADVSLEEGLKRANAGRRPVDTRYYNPQVHQGAFWLPNYVRNLKLGLS